MTARRRSSRSASASPCSRCSRPRRCASSQPAALLLPAAAIAAGVGSASRFAAIVATPRIPGWAVALAAVACAALAAAAVARIPLPAAQPPSHRLRLLLLGAVRRRRARRRGRDRAFRRDRAARVVLPRRVARRVPRASARGTGAATFGHYWASSGKALDLGGALDAHSLYLETLAELGPLGLLLLLAMLLAPLRGALARAARRTCRPRSPRTPPSSCTPGSTGTGSCRQSSSPRSAARAPSPPRSSSRAARSAARFAARSSRVSAAFAACAIAGARSNTIPAATPETTRAPRSGALSQTRA